MDYYNQLTARTLEKQAASLLLGLDDLGTAIATADLLLDREESAWDLSDHNDRRLAEAVVIIYARPFTSGPTMLNKARWPGYSSQRWCKLHERLLTLRHQYLAHSGGVEELRITSGDEDTWSVTLGRPLVSAVDVMAARPMFLDLRERLRDHADAAVRALVMREQKQIAQWPVEISLGPFS